MTGVKAMRTVLSVFGRNVLLLRTTRSVFFSTYRSKTKLVKEADDKRVKHEILFGVAPCLAALQAGRRKIFEVIVGDKALNTTRWEFSEIIELAKKRDVPVRHVPKSKLKMVSGDRPHQNVAMKVEPLKFLKMDKDEDKSAWTEESEYGRPALWLALDEIQDPMNFGAILRTSAFLGVDRIIVPSRNRAPLSPVVCKASSGAMETMDVFEVENMGDFLKVLVMNDWEVLGSIQLQNDTVVDDRNIVNCQNYKLHKPTVLVLGNEGTGINPSILAHCSCYIAIPPPFGKHKLPVGLDCLNVSVAAGIVLFSLLGRHGINSWQAV